LILLVLLVSLLLVRRIGTLSGLFVLNLGYLQAIRTIVTADGASRHQLGASAITWLESDLIPSDLSDTRWIALGLVYESLNVPDEAQKSWRKTGTAYTTFLKKGDLYRQYQQIDLAIGWYNRALIVKPGDIPIQRRLGSLYHSLSRYAEALPYLEASIIVGDPNNLAVREQLCNALRSTGDVEGALAVYQAESDTSAYLELCAGKAYWDIGDNVTAGRHFQRAVHLAPNDASVHFWYSLSLNRSGNLADAIFEAEVAVKLAPSQIGYMEHLLNLYLLSHNWDDAHDLATQILLLDPENLAATTALESLPVLQPGNAQ